MSFDPANAVPVVSPDQPASSGFDPANAVPVASSGAPGIMAPQDPNPPTMAQNFAAGALNAATGIGSTLLWPIDKTLHAIDPSFRSPAQRRASLSSFYRENFDPSSWSFRGGQLAGGIAGTAGIGPALAVPAQAAGYPMVASALATGGMRLGAPAVDAAAPLIARLGTVAGHTALRAGAGALVGGAQAGLIDPSTAASGAMIGGALPVAAQGIGSFVRGVSRLVSGAIGNSTGTGLSSLPEAFKAGQTGNTALVENMRQQVPMENVIDQAQQGIAQMRAAKSAAYRSGMIDISKDQTVLDFKPIQDAVSDIASRGSYKGQQINAKAAGTVQELVDKVTQWGSLDPAEFHTPEGLDALKQAIGDIRDSTQFQTPARTAADKVYNAVKSQIVQQAPTYSKVMSDYSAATDQITELQRALSLKEKSSADTALRKLQSIMRNNVNTNYGNRTAAVQALEQQGNVSLMPSLAGQTLSSWTPRGMTGSIEKGGLPLAMVGMAAAGHAGAIPGMLAMAPFTSPRLMGETAYGLGRLSTALAPGAGQAGIMLGRGAPLLPGLLAENPNQFLLSPNFTAASQR
jgi:hypothetical protein